MARNPVSPDTRPQSQKEGKPAASSAPASGSLDVEADAPVASESRATLAEHPEAAGQTPQPRTLFRVETGRGGSLVFDTEAEAIEWAQQNRRAQGLVSPDEADEVFKSSLRQQLAVLGAPGSEEQDAIDRVKELLGYSDEAARRLVHKTPEEQLDIRVRAAADAIVDFPVSLSEQSHLVEKIRQARMRKADRTR
jgi:hypothetical protein